MPFGFSLRSTGKSREAKLSMASSSSAVTDESSATGGSDAAASSFRMTFLGKQSLNRPTNTGFGSVQKPLRDVYMAYAMAAGSDGKEAADKLSERTVFFQGHDMLVRFWDPGARRFQQEVWPIDCVTYLDLVLFHTVKGKKRHFGYFRRHTDATDVIPDTVLIPLHKREAKMLTKSRHRPLLCFLIRRPYGIQFLECHIYLVDSEQEGVLFIEAFDRQSRAKLQEEQHVLGRGFHGAVGATPWQPDSNNQHVINKWASQPALAASQLHQRQQQQQQQHRHQNHVTASNSAQVGSQGRLDRSSSRRMHQSSSNISGYSDSSASSAAAVPVALVPSQDGAFVVVENQMKRTASGTIFDKYKELQAFNIPEYEYMGFQELQQQLEWRRQQREQQQQQEQQQQHQTRQQQVHHFNAGLGNSQKFPSDGNLRLTAGQCPARLLLQQPPPPPQQLPPAVQRRQRATPTMIQTVGQHRPSTIMEEASRQSQLIGAAAAAAAAVSAADGRDEGDRSVANLVSRFEHIQQPRPQPSALAPADVASSSTELQQQLQQHQQHQVVRRPVARVPPTSRSPLDEAAATSAVAAAAAAQSPAKSVSKVVPMSEQHRIHRSASSRLHQQQQQQPGQTSQAPRQPKISSGVSGSTPDFVASGLGYLP